MTSIDQLPQAKYPVDIEVPTCAEATPFRLLEFSNTTAEAIQRYCQIHLPNAGEIGNAFTGPEGALPYNPYLFENTPDHSGANSASRLFPLVTARPNSDRGYRCEVMLCRSRDDDGFAGCTMVRVDFCSPGEAEQLARYLNHVFSW